MPGTSRDQCAPSLFKMAWHNRRWLMLAAGLAAVVVVVASVGHDWRAYMRAFRMGNVASCPDATAPIRGSIVFGVGTNLMVMEEDGANSMALTALPANAWARDPTWSPDGQTLAYTLVRSDSQRADQFVAMTCGLDRATGKGRILARGAGATDRIADPMWTPDGQALLATLVQPPSDTASHNEEQRTIVRYDLATNTMQPLVPNAIYPAAAPGGQWMAYVQLDHHVDHTMHGGSGQMLMRSRTTGAEATPLVDPRPAFGEIVTPRWSPQGYAVVFGARRGPAPEETTPAPHAADEMHLWIVRHDGQGLRRLTQAGLRNPRFTGSPDGRTVAYTQDDKGIVLLDVARGTERRLTDQSNYGGITWAP